MADTKLADLTALTTPSGDDILYIVDDPAGTPLDRKMALNKLFTRGTITADAPVINASQTWNASGVTFTGLKFNAATGSSAGSAAASLLMDLQLEGVSQFKVSKAGRVEVASNGWFTGSDADSGFQIIDGGRTIDFYRDNVVRFRLGSTVTVGADFSIGATGATGDIFLTRRAAANLRLGAADAATAQAQILSVQSVVAGTSNIAGANFTITGSQGTGSGAGGSIIFQTAAANSGGGATVQNTLANAMVIDSVKTVRLGTGYTVATLPAAGTAGRRTYVTDATSPTFLGTLTGGGAVVCPVFDNGTAWVSA